MDKGSGAPLQKLAHSLQVIVFIMILLYVGQDVFIPLAFGALIAILLISPCNFFERQGFPRISAALISVILGVLFFILIAHVITTQLISFKKDLPLIVQRLTASLEQLEEWVIKEFKVSPENVEEYVNSTTDHMLSRTSILVSTTFFTISKVLFLLLIIPIYTFLILIYRGLIAQFIRSSFKSEHSELVQELLGKTRIVMRSYLAGLFIETIIVAILHCAGFFILGVKYAVLLGVISALLKLIPYLGIISACIICPLVTLATNSPGVVLGVLIVLVLVHLIDGNFIFPIVVGAKVKMNALAIIVGVIIGSALWGIPGMFLAIPIIASLKVIFDNVNGFQPLGLLLGEDASLKKKPVLVDANDEVVGKPDRPE